MISSPTNASLNITGTVAGQLIDWMARLGIDHAFAMPGADIDPLITCLREDDRIKLLPVPDEFLALSMAEGFARRSGRPAAAISCGGPGAASLAAAAAQLDSAPVLMISGSAKPASGFADTWKGVDGIMFNGAGCHTFSIDNPKHLGDVLGHIRVRIAKGEPCHISLDLQVQKSSLEFSVKDPEYSRLPEHEKIQDAGPRPVLAIGSRALSDAEKLMHYVKQAGVPVVTDMDARGIIPEDDDLALGHLGFMPAPAAVAALTCSHDLSASCVMAVAASSSFLRLLEYGGVPVSKVSASSALEYLATLSRPAPDWTSRLADYKMLSRPVPVDRANGFGHGDLVEEVSDAAGPDTDICIDAGIFHQSAVSRLVVRRPRTILATSTLTSMGWSLGAATGAALAGAKRVICLLGDGCLLMRVSGLAAAKSLDVPVTFVVADNGVHGSTRSRHAPGPVDPALLPKVDLCAMGAACGLSSTLVCDRENFRKTLRRYIDSSGPGLIVAKVDYGDPAMLHRATGLPWLDNGK